MTASKNVRIRAALGLGAALAVGAALPAASAQSLAPGRLPAGALLIVDGSGRPVGVLVPSDAARSDAAPQQAVADPMLQMMALQDAMMRQMQAQVADLTQAAAGSDAGTATTGLVIRSVTTGPEGCSRTVVWRQGPADSAPKMVLDQVADRCASGGGTPGAQPLSQPRATAPASGLQSIVDVHAPTAPVARRPF